MRTILITVFCLIFTFQISYTQENSENKPEFGWKKSVISNLNLTQATFENWTAGGENTLAWQLNLNTDFTLDEEKYNWANKGKFNFGQTKVGDQDTRKSDDEINLESVLIYKFGLYINPFASANFVTQFAKGYNYKAPTKIAISNFMDPGYVTLSAGVGYSPADYFKTRVGGAVKITSTKDFPVPYADDPKTLAIEKTKTEWGLTSVTDYKRKIHDNIIYASKLELFSNLKAINEVDVRWDNLFSAKVTEYIAVGLNFQLFYDRDLSIKRQLKEALTLSITYSLL
ncbi:MAG: DUF3078 domain-containing protein [Bacteroidetes bacterium]|nr:DUF3078 domain-containing protein [Bacteroidota bacterium]MBU2585267.1 DUF3078 domain-containing protein [Bacteroidota bacterium]